jgi:hypothetical protein
MQSKTSCSLHSAYFANKFVVIWVAVSAVNIPVFSSANEAHIFGIFKYKTRREYNNEML